MLALRSHSHDVTGIVQAIWRRMLIFGKRAASQSLIATAGEAGLKAGTHEGACSRSTLLQHAPGAKLPRLHQRFLAKKYVAQQNFCS